MCYVCCWKFQYSGRVLDGDRCVFFMRNIIIYACQVRTTVNTPNKTCFQIINNGMFLWIKILEVYLYS